MILKEKTCIHQKSEERRRKKMEDQKQKEIYATNVQKKKTFAKGVLKKIRTISNDAK